MRRIALCALAVVVAAAGPVAGASQTHDHGAAAASASSAKASKHHGKGITFVSSPGQANGYLSLPKGKGRHPAVIVIQEFWGLNDWIKDNTDRFARDGYVALAVDLYRGKSTTDPNVAHELMRGLAEDRAVADLNAGFNLLAKREDVDSSHIGVIGWCMGGGYSLDLAIAEPRLAACVINYGHLVTNQATIEKIQAPILGNFGAKDQGIPPSDVEAFEKALQAAKKREDIKIYPNVGHAFMNPNNKAGYDAGSAADAWARIDAFFAKELKGK
jgi:carboxymethylenebutenolidase